MPERARIAEVVDGSSADARVGLLVFREQLAKLGYLEGRNLEIIEYFTEGVQARLPAIMREVVNSNVDFICTNNPGYRGRREDSDHLLEPKLRGGWGPYFLQPGNVRYLRPGCILHR